MRYCRFQLNGKTEYGLVESVAGQEVITRLLVKPPEGADDLEDLPTKSISRIALSDATLAVPVRPSKIVCVGRNYRAHAAELGNEVPKEPLLFFKPPSSLLPSGGTILRPKISQRTDYEGELAVVMGRSCHKLRADADVRPLILGYTALNDFTARDIQKSDSQWTRGKGFDTFCPVGPIVTNEIDPWAGITVETRVNGDVRQHGNTRDFIFSLEVIIRYISDVMTLVPGDIIATGTPEGVGAVVSGDVIEISVEGVGTLRNAVADE
jgi:2-keto-4-pentenoate hydratase/2-oxohepta-3-ene-1,7-dioic acid hydratase in catechol pathway